MTFHFYKTPTNVLTQQALDPVSKTPEFKVTAIKVVKVGVEDTQHPPCDDKEILTA